MAEADDHACWLNEEEEGAWVALLSVLITLPSALDAQLQSDAGLTLYDYQVMSVLSLVPDRMLRLSDLALITNGSLPRLSQVVTKLEGRGWVTRKPCPTDGRTTFAVLTAAGRKKVVQTAPGHVKRVRELVFDPLSSTQVRQLRDIHRRIRRTIQPESNALFKATGADRKL